MVAVSIDLQFLATFLRPQYDHKHDQYPVLNSNYGVNDHV